MVQLKIRTRTKNMRGGVINFFSFGVRTWKYDETCEKVLKQKGVMFKWSNK